MDTKNIDKFLYSLIENLYSPSEKDFEEFKNQIKYLSLKQKKQLILLFQKKIKLQKKAVSKLKNLSKSTVNKIKEKKYKIKSEGDLEKLLDNI